MCLSRILGREVPVEAIVACVEAGEKRVRPGGLGIEKTNGFADGRILTAQFRRGGRLPQPEAAAGVRGMSGVDREPDGAAPARRSP